jgi:hypothetical protein
VFYFVAFLMLVLDAEASALVVSVGVRDDDAALLGCLEHVSYAKSSFFTVAFLFYLSYSLIF